MDRTRVHKSRIYTPNKKPFPVVDFDRSSTTVLLAKLWVPANITDRSTASNSISALHSERVNNNNPKLDHSNLKKIKLTNNIMILKL